MKKRYTLTKTFDYNKMPPMIQDYFNNHYKHDDLNVVAFFINSIAGKSKHDYNGKAIICKWTYGEDKTTLIIERGDNLLLDYLIDNGLNLREDDFVIIKY
jgi:hypothetical protein